MSTKSLARAWGEYSLISLSKHFIKLCFTLLAASLRSPQCCAVSATQHETAGSDVLKTSRHLPWQQFPLFSSRAVCLKTTVRETVPWRRRHNCPETQIMIKLKFFFDEKQCTLRITSWGNLHNEMENMFHEISGRNCRMKW